MKESHLPICKKYAESVLDLMYD